MAAKRKGGIARSNLHCGGPSKSSCQDNMCEDCFDWFLCDSSKKGAKIERSSILTKIRELSGVCYANGDDSRAKIYRELALNLESTLPKIEIGQ